LPSTVVPKSLASDSREIGIRGREVRTPPDLVPFFALGGISGRVQLRRISDGSLLADFTAYPVPYTGSVTAAVGDLNGDGYPDLIVGAASGNPHIKIYDGHAIATGTFNPGNPDASLVTQFFAYGTNYNIGANVAVGDVNGDGYLDLITGTTAGNPHVKVFDGRAIATGTFDAAHPDASLITSFFAYGLNYNVGVNVAAGDIIGDGFADVVTGATVGNPHVKVFSGKDIATGTFDQNNPDASLLASFFGQPYLQDNIGAFVAVGDINGDGYGDIIVGATRSAGMSLTPAVGVFSGQAIANHTFDNNNPDASLLSEFAAYIGATSPTGTAVAAADFEGDGTADVLLGLHQGSPTYRVVDPLRDETVNNIVGTFPVYPNNIFVGA
jgi:hypothetical protein